MLLAEPQPRRPEGTPLVQTSTHVPDTLIESWERQQDAYVNHREQRFAVILDTLEHARPGLDTVLDVGGGLGSFSKLILERFPSVRVITLDYDPALLELARHNLRDFADRSTIVEANLLDVAWPDALAGTAPDAVVSSTALHWLPGGGLVTLYGQLAEVLAEGGVFFNADHLSHARPGSLFHAASRADDARQQSMGFAAGVPDWDGWWRRLRAADGFAELVAERDRRFDSSANADSTATFHTEALRVAGFAESGTIWQYFDDFVVYGVR
jgi:trans-aconitate methyltransferase